MERSCFHRPASESSNSSTVGGRATAAVEKTDPASEGVGGRFASPALKDEFTTRLSATEEMVCFGRCVLLFNWSKNMGNDKNRHNIGIK